VVRRFALVLLLTVPLTAAGTLAAHTAAYALLNAPSEGVHGYLGHLPQLLTLLALPVLLALAVAGRARSPRAWPFAAAALAAFVAQEHVERLAHTGEVPFLLDRPVFLVGLAVQLPFALAAWLVARLLIRVAAALRPQRRRFLRRHTVAPLRRFSFIAARSLVAVGAAAPRGPPVGHPSR
jgi:hypothetical protein